MAWLMVVSLVMGRNFLGSKRAMLVWRQMRYANLLSSASLWIIVEALLFGTHGSLHFTARTRSKCDVCHVIRIFSSEAQSPMTGAVHPRTASIASLRGVLAAVCGMVLVWMVGTANGAADFDRLLSSLTQRWGSAPTAKFNAWRAMVQAGTTSSDLDRIKRVNSFFNQQLQVADRSGARQAAPDLCARQNRRRRGGPDTGPYGAGLLRPARCRALDPGQPDSRYPTRFAQTGSGTGFQFQQRRGVCRHCGWRVCGGWWYWAFVALGRFVAACEGRRF